MNKKFMAMLLVIVMVVSMVPMTAMAADCTAEHTYVYQGNGKCQAICTECGYNHTGRCKGNPCERCGNYVEPETPACDDTLGAYASNGNGTHTARCACGNVTSTRDCDLVDGVCTTCGYTVPGCTHELGAYVSNNDGTHTAKCECEGYTHTGRCTKGADGKCATCGYTFPAAEPECDDELGAYASNNDGTHTASCECGKSTHTGRCTKGADGKCATCGYTFPAAEPECDDELGAYVPNGDGTHTASCECGNVTHTRNCEIEDGVCTICGYVYECNDEVVEYVSNGDGTHTGACACGNVTHTGRCTKGADGKCATCGYTFPAAEPKCDDELGEYVSNGDGTHTASCECGNITHTRKCEIVNGVCVICGAKEPVVPQEPVQLPAYAAASTAGLDSVPKTGCAFVEWLYALIFG